MKRNRILSMLLCAALVFTVLPAAVPAEESPLVTDSGDAPALSIGVGEITQTGAELTFTGSADGTVYYTVYRSDADVPDEPGILAGQTAVHTASDPAHFTFDVSEGHITINDAGSGELTVTYGLVPQTTTDAFANTQEITITGATTEYTVTAESGVTANIILSGVDIDVSAALVPACAFDMAGATVNLTLVGDNSLKSSRHAGLRAPAGATLAINGDGALTAEKIYKDQGFLYGAGIGGGMSEAGGTITISSGTVTAVSHDSGAGIGGGRGGAGGTVTISGGTVTASSGNGAGIGGGDTGVSGGIVTVSGGIVTASGTYGAGIGGGRDGVGGGIVTVSGGIVTASSTYGAGIGGGYSDYSGGAGGTVYISGGSVRAIGGPSAEAIGYGVDSESSGTLMNKPVLEGGVKVYLTTVTLAGAGEAAVTSLTAGLSGAAYAYGMDDVKTDADGKLYLYLPETANTTAARTLSTLYAGSVTTTTNLGTSWGILSADAAAPTVSSVTPSGTGAALGGSLIITFSEEMRAGAGTVSLNGAALAGGSWNTGKTAYTLSYSGLAYGTAYTVTISGFEDYSGNEMALDDSHSFTTQAAPGTAPTITTTSLPGGTVGTPYSHTLAATGDTPITWTIDSGSLPNGLSLSGNTISGTPTTAGNFGFTVKAENSEGSDTKVLEIVIGSTPPVGTAPTITTTSLPDGRVGSSYSRSLAADGDTPITWTIDSGSLPNGLTLGGSTGVISGTPTARGSFSFTVKATNAVGSVTKNLSITINAASTGGGAGGSDSGSSVSGGSGDSTPITIQPEKKPDQPVMAGFNLAPAVDGNGRAALTILQQSVADAIAKARADAKAQGKTANGIGVSLNVSLPDTAKSLAILLPRDTLQSLVDAGVKQVEIDGVIPSLEFDLEALKEILRQSTGNVTITIQPAQNLSDAAKKLIGARPAYDVTISYVRDGRTVEITSLGRGRAVLSIPYAPNRNEAVGWLFGVYADVGGGAARISGSAYDANSGSIILSAGSFSVYGVGYTAPAEKYTDIEKHWARESIDYVVGRGLFSGTADTSFSPDTAMDRGMLVTILGRLAVADVSAYTTSSFSDVAAGQYYLPYVEWAYQKDIIGGVGNGKFAPERAVTREEIALILQNYAKATGFQLPVTREAITFADADRIGSSYREAVKAMQQAGVMTGGSGSRFNPKSGATRAEIAAMLHRYVKLTIDPATAQGWALNDAGQWLYHKDGKPLTGWQTIDGVRYCFYSTGALQTGWVKDGDSWRFYDRNRALTGWRDIGGETGRKRYYFDANAVMVSGKWLQIDDKWYYFHADGALAVSTKIDGYEVDENGVRKIK